MQPLPPENLRNLRAISAIETLVRRGVQLPLAKVSIEALVHDPSHPVSVHLPRLEGAQEFAAEWLIA